MNTDDNVHKAASEDENATGSSPMVTKKPQKPLKERKQSVFVGRIIEVRDKKGVLQAAIPTVHRAFAWICLFFNVFVPGLGTFFMAFPALFGAKTSSKKPNKCSDFLLNIFTSFLQLATAILIVGWIFSIYWGMNFVNQANEEYHRQKLKKQEKPIYKKGEK